MTLKQEIKRYLQLNSSLFPSARIATCLLPGVCNYYYPTALVERMQCECGLQRRGELVACKVFRSDVSNREEVARQREFKAMMQLKHDNIVRFIAVEQEVDERCICSGRSRGVSGCPDTRPFD